MEELPESTAPRLLAPPAAVLFDEDEPPAPPAPPVALITFVLLSRLDAEAPLTLLDVAAEVLADDATAGVGAGVGDGPVVGGGDGGVGA